MFEWLQITFENIHSARRIMWVLLFVFVTLPMAMYWAYDDGRYYFYGKVTEASVVQASRINPPDNKMIRVTYEFTEVNGDLRRETDELPAWCEAPEGLVTIEYIPNERLMSRVDGQITQFQFFAIYFGGLVVVVGGIFVVVYLVSGDG